jgi:hypothetical protein
LKKSFRISCGGTSGNAEADGVAQIDDHALEGPIAAAGCAAELPCPALIIAATHQHRMLR